MAVEKEMRALVQQRLRDGFLQLPQHEKHAAFWGELGGVCPLELLADAPDGQILPISPKDSILGLEGALRPELVDRLAFIIEGIVLAVGRVAELSKSAEAQTGDFEPIKKGKRVQTSASNSYYGAIYLPGDVIGEYDLYRHGEERLVELEALTDVKLYSIPLSRIIEIAKQYPSILLSLNRSTIQKTVRHHTHLKRKHRLDAKEACRLQMVELARIIGTPTGHHSTRADSDNEILIEILALSKAIFAALINKDESYVGTNLSKMIGVVGVEGRKNDLAVLRLRAFLGEESSKKLLDEGDHAVTARALAYKALQKRETYDKDAFDRLMKAVQDELRRGIKPNVTQAP